MAFQHIFKELRLATAESAALAAEADEQEVAERELDQIVDQMDKWDKVRQLQDRKEDLVKAALSKASREAQQRKETQERLAMEVSFFLSAVHRLTLYIWKLLQVDQDEDVDDIDFLLDWRSKAI